MVVEPISLFEIAKTLKKPLDDVYELGKSKFKRKLDKWKADKNINNLYKNISSIQNVKTIWQVDKEVNLKKFYYPSKLIIDNIPQTISSIKKIPIETNVVIQGTVGQGKSIFLRYLCSQELRGGTKIPVFFELRKIQNEKTLKQHLSDVLDSWGFEIDNDLFDFFANSGKFIFLLDGFDEIDPASIGRIINELDLFSEKYRDLRIIVTSRPDSGIEKSVYFRVYNLAPLKKQDHAGILKKLIDNEEQVKNILKALGDSSTQINELLTTPLMMTLLVLVYKAEQKIPEQFSEFYENLFQTLLLRHDKSKPGYVRAKNCPINERKLQEIFETFCFFASKESLTTMNSEKIYQLANESIQQTRVECDASSFIKDISKIACLVIEEGLDFHFIHKSVREYHAASFIKRRPDEFAIKFYQAMLQHKMFDWKQELNFLYQVDEYRFTKYFLIPHMESILQKLDCIECLRHIDDICVEEELMRSSVIFNENTMEIYSFMTRRSAPLFLEEFSLAHEVFWLVFNKVGFLSDDVKNNIKEKALEHPVEKEITGVGKLQIKAIDFIELANLNKEVLIVINKKYENLFLKYKERCEFVENEEKKKDMLNFDNLF